jgi:GTP cyclohydrolase I
LEEELMASTKAAVRMIRFKAEDRSVAPLIRELLERLGEDSQRDGLCRTPPRVDKALRFLTSGHQMDIQRIVNGALCEVKYDAMVVVKDIEVLACANTICYRSSAGCTWPICRNRRS